MKIKEIKSNGLITEKTNKVYLVKGVKYSHINDDLYERIPATDWNGLEIDGEFTYEPYGNMFSGVCDSDTAIFWKKEDARKYIEWKNNIKLQDGEDMLYHDCERTNCWEYHIVIKEIKGDNNEN